METKQGIQFRGLASRNEKFPLEETSVDGSVWFHSRLKWDAHTLKNIDIDLGFGGIQLSCC